MKKILFIDSWSQGKKFIVPVVKEFQKHFYQCIFLHADSQFLNTTFKDIEPIIDYSYEDHDINEYNNSLQKAFTEINPDAVIFVSIHGIFHRWANFVAEYFKIPCFFFMHGIRISNPRKINKRNLVYSAKRVIFYTKQFNLFAKDIIRIRGTNVSTLQILSRFYTELIFRNYSFTNKPNIDLGFNYKVIFINAKQDIDYFKTNYPLNHDAKFIISGNVSAIESAIKSLELNYEKKYITFISQPGLIAYKDYFALILRLNSFFKNSEFIFLLRPHPRDTKEFINQLQQNDIQISFEVEEIDFARSCAAIGINSAMLLGFMYLKKPIIQIEDGINPGICSMLGYEKTIFIDFFLLGKKELIIKEIKKMMGFNLSQKDLETPSQIIFKNVINFLNK